MHIVAQSFRRIDEPLSSAPTPAPAVAEVVIDELDECMDDNDEMLFLLIFGDTVKPGAMMEAAVSVEHICRLFSNGYNDADDDDDVENIASADVSSSVNGSERVRWWKQLRWLDLVICVTIPLVVMVLAIDPNITAAVVVVVAVAGVTVVIALWFIKFVAIIDDDFILQRCAKCSGDLNSLGEMHDMDDVNEAVVVIGNENALWCDTVNWSFDARTEKLFAATTVQREEKQEKKTRTKKETEESETKKQIT